MLRDDFAEKKKLLTNCQISLTGDGNESETSGNDSPPRRRP